MCKQSSVWSLGGDFTLFVRLPLNKVVITTQIPTRFKTKLAKPAFAQLSALPTCSRPPVSRLLATAGSTDCVRHAWLSYRQAGEQQCPGIPPPRGRPGPQPGLSVSAPWHAGAALPRAAPVLPPSCSDPSRGILGTSVTPLDAARSQAHRVGAVSAGGT